MIVYVLFIALIDGLGCNNNFNTSIDVFTSAEKCLEARNKLEENINKSKYKNTYFKCVKRSINK